MSTQTNKWQTDKEGFISAIRSDGYAEYELSSGDILITDWEGDGTFNPYIEPRNGFENMDRDTIECEMLTALANTFNVEICAIEYDETNNVFVPYFSETPN